MEENLLHSPLEPLVMEAKGRMVAFAGWFMPVSYEGILNEHKAVRQQCGLFDVSHMGRFFFTGSQSARLLDKVLTNRVLDLEPGQGRYSLMCRVDGGIMDDVIVFRISKENFLLVVNGATREKDWQWIEKSWKEFPEVTISDMTLNTAMMAVQGPQAPGLVQDILSSSSGSGEKLGSLKRFHIACLDDSGQAPLLASRTGYTGEDGFEFYGPPEPVKKLWQQLTEKGATPAGLGARDILRLEKGYILYGQDVTEEENPFEARLSWTVELDEKEDFTGKEALADLSKQKPAKKLVGIKVLDRPIPREGFPVFQKGEKTGRITSGGFSPETRQPIAFAWVEGFQKEWDSECEVDIRGRRVAAKIVKPPFV
jgi:aminomethyltransferase